MLNVSKGLQRMPTNAPSRGILKGAGTLDSAEDATRAGESLLPGSTRGSNTQQSDSSLNFKDFKGKWYNPADWIYWSFSRGDSEKMRAQVKLCPITFRDETLEESYVTYLQTSYTSRCFSFSIMCFFIVIFYVILTAWLLALQIVETTRTFILRLALPMAAPLLGLAFFVSRIPRWNFTKKDPELYTTLAVGALAASICLVQMRFSEAMYDVPSMSTSVALKLWADAWLFGGYMIGILSITTVFRIRMKRVMLVGTFLMLCATAPLIYQLSHDIPPNVFVPPGVTRRFLQAVCSIQIFIIFGTECMTMGARFYKEIIERIDFARRQTRIKQVVALVNDRKKRKKGGTLIEDLLDLMEKAKNVLTVVALRHQDASALTDASTVLDECLDCLRNTDELYTVHVGGDQGDYIHMYAQGARHQTPLNLTDARDDITPLERTVRVLLDVPYGGPEAVTPDDQILAKLSPDVGRKWKVNFLQLKKDVPHLLLHVGTALLQPYIVDLQIKPQVMHQFLTLAGSKYADNPYHNDAHGAMVAHVAYFLVSSLTLFEKLNNNTWAYPAVIIAGLCHDVGHPGCGNAFYINAQWKLAQLYNDTSVLENYHACLTFTMLSHTQTDMFARYSVNSLREIRKRIVEMILATDMSQHYEALSRYRLRKKAADFNIKDNIEDAWMTARMCIKTADLGHAMIDWQTHVQWSLRVTEEFYKQGEEETRLGLPMSPLCNRETHSDFAKSQKGFLEYVVMPLLREVEEVDTTDTISSELTRGLVYNRFRWEELAGAGDTVEIPDEVRAINVHYALPLKLLGEDFRIMVKHRKELLKTHMYTIETSRAAETAAQATPLRTTSNERRGAIAI